MAETNAVINLLWMAFDSQDKESWVQNAIDESITNSKYKLTRTINIDEGIRVLRDEKISIIILDCDFSQFQHQNSLKIIHEQFSSIPVLLIMPFENNELGLNALQMGAQDFIVKNQIYPEAFSRVIQKCIFRKEKEKKLIHEKEQAVRSASFQESFLSSMSHEIRSPLNSLLGFIDLSLDKGLSQEEKFEYLTTAKKSGHFLLQLVNDILEMSALKAEKFKLDPIDFDLRSKIFEVIQILEPRVMLKQIKLKSIISNDVPKYFRGDVRRLQQVLINLIGNAIKFTDQGEVCLEITALNKKIENECVLEFKVKDTGSGISEEQVSRLFLPFSQAHSQVQILYGGTGLGLHISKGIISLMRGEIKMKSIVGQGTEVTVCIPITVVENKINTTQNKILKPKAKATIPHWNVLIAEDNIDNTLLMKAYLKGYPLQLHFVTNGKEAYEAVREQYFHLIFMDMQMPIMDGYEATQKIRQWEIEQAHPPVPIVACSASVMSEELMRMKESGCSLILSKPFSKEGLFSMIDALLGIKSESSSVMPINETDTKTPDFILAKARHQLWLKKLESYILGLETLTQGQISSHLECDLGKWLHFEGMKSWGQLSEMQNLSDLHIQLHQAGQLILKAQEAHDLKSVQSAFKNACDISKELLSLLDHLDQKVESINKSN